MPIFHTSPWGLKQAWADLWAIAPSAVNKAKGGMWWYGWCYVVCGWCMIGVRWWLCGVMWWLSGVWVVVSGVWVKPPSMARSAPQVFWVWGVFIAA